MSHNPNRKLVRAWAIALARARARGKPSPALLPQFLSFADRVLPYPDPGVEWVINAAERGRKYAKDNP
jgi:hypothetical protein